MLNKNLVYLVHLPQWNTSQPPMGISYIGATLQNNGIDVITRDLSIEFYHTLMDEDKILMSEYESHKSWLDENSFNEKILPKLKFYLYLWAKQIIAKSPFVVGFSVLTTNKWASIYLAKLIKEMNPKIKILFGGPLVAKYDSANTIISYKQVDFVIPGEGEKSCLNLIKTLQKDEAQLNQVNGLIFKENNEIIETPPQALIADLDDISFPSYLNYPAKVYDPFIIPILSSRGCVFNCTFCSETVLWKKFRYRSAQNILDEIKFHSRYSPTCYYYFVDSLINGNIKELKKFCELVIEDGIKIMWGGKAAIRAQMTEELLKLMAQAGCIHLDFGIESGSPKVIRDMRKSFTVEVAKKVLKHSHEAGIKNNLFMLVGFPTESEQDYQYTKSFLKDVEPFVEKIMPGFGMDLLPGADVTMSPEKYGISFKNGTWYSEFSTPENRSQRVQDFWKFCETLDVVVG